jgi:SSS family solute:Na+ symporter
LGLFWKKATNHAAIIGALISIPVAMFFKIAPKGWASGMSFEFIFPNVPFLDQMGYTTLITMAIIMALSWLQNKDADDSKGFALHQDIFKTSAAFNISAFTILLILTFLYAKFW